MEESSMTPGINAARKAAVPHTIHEYEHDPASESYGIEAAEKTGVDPARVFKTLVVAIDGKELVVGIVPVTAMLNMKLIARAARGKKAAMAEKEAVERTTGYVLGGVSPLGQKKKLKTFIDDSALGFDTIFVSAGRRGLEIELAPRDLATLVNGGFFPLHQEVTLLLLLGALAGPELLDLLPPGADAHFGFITQLTLAMVGFLLGERMAVRNLAEGREAVIVSLAVTLVTAAFVAVAVWLVTRNLAAALLLGSIATATAPAATLDTLKEAGANGPLTRLVFQVVAIDDAWGAMLFSVCLVGAQLLLGNGDTGLSTLATGFLDVGGAVLLGIVLGLPMAWLTGRLRPGEPMLLESAGFVFVAAGIASFLGLSYLLTCMTLGIVVANRARHHVRPFRSIEGISEPFLALFFFMAGYQLEWAMLPTLGALGLAYVAARIAGRLAGGRFGGYLAGSEPHTRKRIGACLMPQAGVALGLALLATERLPELTYILPLVIGATVIFELVGPPLTLIQLRRAGETGKGYQDEPDED
eukprot:g4641.t1